MNPVSSWKLTVNSLICNPVQICSRMKISWNLRWNIGSIQQFPPKFWTLMMMFITWYRIGKYDGEKCKNSILWLTVYGRTNGHSRKSHINSSTIKLEQKFLKKSKKINTLNQTTKNICFSKVQFWIAHFIKGWQDVIPQIFSIFNGMYFGKLCAKFVWV